MEFAEETLNGVKVLHLSGKIMDDPQSQVTCQHLDNLIQSDVKCLVMDFNDVQWINSSGTGVIISCLRRLRQKGGDIRFANLHHSALHYFHITKLETVVARFDSVETAVASFTQEQAA